MQMTIGDNDFRAPDGGGYLRVCNDETGGEYVQCFRRSYGDTEAAIRVTDRASFERAAQRVARDTPTS